MIIAIVVEKVFEKTSFIPDKSAQECRIDSYFLIK